MSPPGNRHLLLSGTEKHPTEEPEHAAERNQRPMRVARPVPSLRDPIVSPNDPQTAENGVEGDNGGPCPEFWGCPEFG